MDEQEIEKMLEELKTQNNSLKLKRCFHEIINYSGPEFNEFMNEYLLLARK